MNHSINFKSKSKSKLVTLNENTSIEKLKGKNELFVLVYFLHFLNFKFNYTIKQQKSLFLIEAEKILIFK